MSYNGNYSGLSPPEYPDSSDAPIVFPEFLTDDGVWAGLWSSTALGSPSIDHGISIISHLHDAGEGNNPFLPAPAQPPSVVDPALDSVTAAADNGNPFLPLPPVAQHTDEDVSPFFLSSPVTQPVEADLSPLLPAPAFVAQHTDENPSSFLSPPPPHYTTASPEHPILAPIRRTHHRFVLERFEHEQELLRQKIRTREIAGRVEDLENQVLPHFTWIWSTWNAATTRSMGLERKGCRGVKVWKRRWRTGADVKQYPLPERGRWGWR